jgi:outer membrane protein TolC
VNTKTAPLLTLALLLAACATQTYEPKPLQAADVAEAFSAKTLADAGLGEVAAWGLPELTQAALRLHPDLNVARAQWRAAQANEITAGQKPNPTMSTSGEHHSKHQGVSPWTLNLGIDIPFETHGKREARMEQTAALSETARLDIAQTAWNIRSRVRARLLDIYVIEQQAAQLQREETLRMKIVELLEARVAAGLVSGTDLSDARLQWQKAHSALAAETARLPEARAALADAIGLPDNALANTPLSFAAFEQPGMLLPSRDVQRAALLNRLEIRKALASYDAAEAKLKLEIAKQYPDFSLSPGASWDQNDVKWSLGISLLLAILNKNEGPIAEARAARELEAQHFNALQANIIGEQSQAWARWQGATAEIPKSQQLVASQQARLAQTQRQFDTGYADRLELTTAQLELVTAEATVLAAQIKAQRALGALEDTTQQPLDGSQPLPQE